MDVLAAAIALGPVLLILILLLLRIRQLWPRRGVTSSRQWPGQGGDPAGDREPRRPLAPANAGSVALPLPTEEDPPPAEPSRVTLTSEGRRGLRAS